MLGAIQRQIWKWRDKPRQLSHPPSVPMRSGVFHIQSVLCRQLWQDDAWGASCEGCALVTPQLDFGFHKASPLFTLTGCAGYWPGKSAQDGLSCKEEGRLVMYRLVLGPSIEPLLETPCSPSLHTFFSLFHPTIHLSPVQITLSSRIVGGVFVTGSPRAISPTPPSRWGHSSLLSRG